MERLGSLHFRLAACVLACAAVGARGAPNARAAAPRTPLARRTLARATAPQPADDWPEPRAAGAPARATAREIASSAALIAGTTVGAGALALPGATAPCGFVPSAAALVVGWALMASSGLLVAEVTAAAARETSSPGVGLLAATELTLGSRAGAVAGAGSALVQLALLSAYTAQGGDDVSRALAAAAGAAGVAAPPPFVGPFAFTAALGGCAALGNGRVLGVVNALLVGALLASFAALLALAAPAVSARGLLEPRDWGRAVDAFPICVLALVFHNVVPAVTRALRGEASAIRLAVLGGSAVPLVMFLLWDGAVLGAAPIGGADGPPAVVDALAPLRALGERGGLAGSAVPAFSIAAVGTSYLGFCIGQHDVLVDAMRVTRGDRAAELGAYALVLGPPLALACALPGVFAPALDVAGTFGVSTLYALLPAALAWTQRSRSQPRAPSEPLLPGGRGALLAVGGAALAVVVEGALDQAGLL
ncbi:hypothetical protein KFE25_008230 [Diacronema lutheri]|uniref:Tyrosine-specific transport protein n=1 Tax=Diacronema lutheri TaxID=2081491 RepID=A0A8J6CD83_DIALT|nr:hypothetical protein KFE25_008230 [Diacronema lutheri]